MRFYGKNSKIRQKKRIIVLAFVIIIGAVILGYLLFFAKITKNSQGISKATEISKTRIIPEKSQSICLDPGHGGSDVGATWGNISEKDINLTVALQVRDLLLAEGYKVFTTRTTDVKVAKRSRATYCNSVNATIMVDIHHNTYATDTSVDYGTALYYKASDKGLAASILNATSSELNIKNDGIAKFDDSELYIANMPATLSEAFFMTNNTEYDLISQSNSARLKTEADSITKGINNYFLNPNPTENTADAGSLIIDRVDTQN